MQSSAAVWLVLLLMAVAANLPFANERLFVVGPVRTPKSLAWRLLELLLFGAAAVGIGLLLEARAGQLQLQGWEFYAVLVCLLFTFAFPGFVWRYLRRHRPSA